MNVCLSIDSYELSLIPLSGEFRFYVNLSQLVSHTPSEVIKKLIDLGYEPKLRFIEHNGKSQFIALACSGSVETINNTIENDWEELASQIEPSIAVRLQVSKSSKKLAA